MKNLHKYVESLTKRVKVNKRALKISEKGVSMEAEKYYGFFISNIRCDMGDAILKIETTGVDLGAEMISLSVVDDSGLTLITADEPKFKEKVMEKLKDLDGKRVFLYHGEFTIPYLERYMQGLKFDIVDLRAEARDMFGMVGMEPRSIKSIIDIPWDPISPGDVPEAWRQGEMREVKAHAVAESIRLYYLYMLYVVKELMNLPVGYHRRIIFSAQPSKSGRIKLPVPNWTP